MEQYIVTGMSCAACQARVEKAVAKVPGVSSVSVSLLTNSMGVEGSAQPSDVIRAVKEAGYGAEIKSTTNAHTGKMDFSAEEEALKDRETPRLKRRLFLSAGFLLVLMYITMGFNMWGWPLPEWLATNHLTLALVQMVLAAIVMIINRDFYKNGFRALIKWPPNMDTLVALGSGVSFAWSLYVFYSMCALISGPGVVDAPGLTDWLDGLGKQMGDLYHHLYFESAAMIPALITIGKTLEALSKGRTTNALKSLMSLAPKKATVIRDGKETEIPADDIRTGDIFIVRPGDSIPADGVVVSGVSAVNESALTGESIPVDKAEGDPVSTATINQSGHLTCRATRVGGDTTLAQIIRLVSDAAATKAPIARIADRVSGVFVPAVILIAAVVTGAWMITGKALSYALARGISVLVVSCPCALGLATPVAVMVGNGVGAKNGILFKTGEALETAGKTQIVVLDKTGTITSGQPQVTDLIPADGVSRDELLEKAYALESKSEHPLARAIVAAAEQEKTEVRDAEQFRALPGNGLEGFVGGKRIRGGNREYILSAARMPDGMAKQAEDLARDGKTPLFFAEEGRMLGMIAVADTIKDDSAEAIRQMHRQGMRVIMVTGDNELTARAIGEKAGVDEVAAGVKPDEKEEIIRRLQQLGKTAMIGDGINDAPALTRADTGIAIGAGTDVAIESADVVLMNSSLRDAAAAIRLSRQTLRNIHENLFWAFFYNLICIPLAAGVLLWKMNPMISAAAMSLSSVTVCMNALRLNLFRVHDTGKDRPVRGEKLPDRLLPEKVALSALEAADRTGMQKTVRIGGMMCEHCEATVQHALETLPFISEAEVRHEAGTAVITLTAEADEEAIRAAVEENDYEYRGME